MKVNAYVIYDQKAEIYNKPFYMHNHAIAKRAMVDLRLDPNTDIHNHPEDFILFSIGTYEDTTAEFKPHQPKVICRAHEIPLPTITETEEHTPELKEAQ